MECRFCRRPTEILLGGVPVCEECYQNAGSCCLEFGGDDLWAEREQASAKEAGGIPQAICRENSQLGCNDRGGEAMNSEERK